ncbi:MAG TPA: histidine triad nucleotide-binding protein [Longimicrobiales bacterium]
MSGFPRSRRCFPGATRPMCIFCKIVNEEIPAAVVYSDDDVIAFRDLHPKAPLHVLIIPRRHISSVNDVEADDAAVLGRLFVAARAVAESEGVAKSGYRLVMNTGSHAGQTVDHIHLHILAGRAMSWPPG